MVGWQATVHILLPLKKADSWISSICVQPFSFQDMILRWQDACMRSLVPPDGLVSHESKFTTRSKDVFIMECIAKLVEIMWIFLAWSSLKTTYSCQIARQNAVQMPREKRNFINTPIESGATVQSAIQTLAHCSTHIFSALMSLLVGGTFPKRDSPGFLIVKAQTWRMNPRKSKLNGKSRHEDYLINKISNQSRCDWRMSNITHITLLYLCSKSNKTSGQPTTFLNFESD